MALEDIQRERLKKLANLKSLGIEPFPAQSSRQQTIQEARKMEGSKVVIAGRVRSFRTHGKIIFADLEDSSGKIQLFFAQTKLSGEQFDLLGNIDLGDFLQASGEVFQTQAGEISVKVAEFTVLAKSLRPLPSSWYGLEDVEERFRQRYVDLIMSPEVRKVFDARHQTIRFMRKFMEEKGFTEVETPTLQPVYGGATAKPFSTHHNALDIDLYLRISDELYLKRLIVGGFEKIFEICKDFRNEGIDRQHNPEFTMMEFYWAYANYEDLMKLTEELVSGAVKAVHGNYLFENEGQQLDFTPPFNRVSFADIVKTHCGIDVNEANTEEKLLAEVKSKNIKLDLEGVIGFGPLCDQLYKEVARPKLLQPTFVVDYPAAMKPLSKKTASDPNLSASFQLLAMGYELVNAYNELNDPLEQRERWEEQMKLGKAGLNEFQVVDEDYLRALEYGMPPTAGWGMGIDRFVALLMNQTKIKDVILFPTMKPEKKLAVSSLPAGQAGQHLTVSNQSPVPTTNPEPPTTNPLGITRQEAYQMLTEMVESKNLVRHGLAVEAIMKALAQKFGENTEEWGIVGLLHDADYEVTNKDPKRHTLEISRLLREKGVSERIIQAIQAHSDEIKPNRENSLEKAVYAADELSGLITACALVSPDKKLSVVRSESVLKKFKSPSFAAGAKRENILTCEKDLEIPLEEFVKIALVAMQGVATELGL